MKIALDWDDTFTRDPEFWARFIRNARIKGHEVFIVTFRDPEHDADINYTLDELDISVRQFYTGGVQKRKYMAKIGVFPDVWIDDSPEFIVERNIEIL